MQFYNLRTVFVFKRMENLHVASPRPTRKPDCGDASFLWLFTYPVELSNLVYEM